ncbi:MAG: DUF302 domain-containing protein [Hyphomicrobiales bacterium]|nr:DUF302 domain-containing protein [Hyphomicrobiales bacterium]
MSYTIDRIFQTSSFDTIVERARTALQDQGFGVLTEIDVKATMKKKIDEDMNDYLILGACNPKLAFGALGIEPKVGSMLPCNVIVRSLDNGDVEVSAVDPQASMAGIDNAELQQVAGKVKGMLQTVVANI